MNSTSKPKTTPINDVPTIIHHGYNIRDYRKMRKLSQAELAKDLGKGWDQKKVSDLEKQESIEENILAKVAEALKVSVDELKDNREATVYNIQHNYEGSNNKGPNYQYNYQPTFNPIDKVVELYERLLATEKEKIELLKKK